MEAELDSMYTERFPISEHKLTAATIDETCCLSDVKPGCFIHLAEKEFVHGEEHHYMKEDPPGTFQGLMADETYRCYIQGSEGETCSCGRGAPCTNPMICKDWDHRFANAIKAGGNPILFTGT